jgi:hypothetical protein
MSLSRLEDEILALESIYGDDIYVEKDDTARGIAARVHYISPPLRIRFALPLCYPDEAPTHDVRQQGVPSAILASVSAGMPETPTTPF